MPCQNMHRDTGLHTQTPILEMVQRRAARFINSVMAMRLDLDWDIPLHHRDKACLSLIACLVF